MRPVLLGSVLLCLLGVSLAGRALLTGAGPGARGPAAWRAFLAPEGRSGPSAGRGASAAPALLLEPLRVDLGSVEPGSRHDVAVRWRRQGQGTVRVLGAQTSCGCLAWSDAWPQHLLAGEQGGVGLTLTAPTAAGPTEFVARLVLDVPAPDDVLRVSVRAFVGTRMVVRPAYVDLGRRSAGGRVNVRVSVHVPPALERAVVAAEFMGWTAQARVEASPLCTQRGPDVLVEGALPVTPGPTQAFLRVRAGAGDEVCVPLLADIVDATEVPGPRPAARPTEGPRVR